jgi:predicted porin
MRAFVVIESGVSIDSGNTNGQNGAAGSNASAGNWASRDSYAGLGGGWGDVRFGRQSPYYGNGVISQGSSNYLNHAVDAAFSAGGAVAGPTGRESNVVSYNSPTIGGFSASVSWGPGTPGSEGNAFTGTGQEKEALWAVTGRYTSGALRFQGDWAKRSDAGNVANVDRTGWKVGAGFAYAPGSQVSFIYGKHESENPAAIAGIVAAGDDPEVTIWIANWEHMIGQWQLIAQYASWGKLKGLSADPGNTDAKGYTLAAKYFLSKRTGVYASLNAIRNKDNAFWDLSSAAYSSGALAVANRGADLRIVALGIMHNF